MNTKVNRNGAALFDVIIAATLIMTTLAVVTPLVVSAARVWKQTRDFQIACDELSAKMDWLVAMPSDRRLAALKSLPPSDLTKAQLIDAALAGEVIDDQDGKRIKLSINWRRLADPPPVTLVAWLRPTAAKDSHEIQSDESIGADPTEDNEEQAASGKSQ